MSRVILTGRGRAGGLVHAVLVHAVLVHAVLVALALLACSPAPVSPPPDAVSPAVSPAVSRAVPPDAVPTGLVLADMSHGTDSAAPVATPTPAAPDPRVGETRSVYPGINAPYRARGAVRTWSRRFERDGREVHDHQAGGLAVEAAFNLELLADTFNARIQF